MFLLYIIFLFTKENKRRDVKYHFAIAISQRRFALYLSCPILSSPYVLSRGDKSKMAAHLTVQSGCMGSCLRRISLYSLWCNIQPSLCSAGWVYVAAWGCARYRRHRYGRCVRDRSKRCGTVYAAFVSVHASRLTYAEEDTSI